MNEEEFNGLCDFRHNTSRQALNSRQQGLLSCWSSCLEHPAGRYDISTIVDDFLSTAENLAFQTVLPGTFHLI